MDKWNLIIGLILLLVGGGTGGVIGWLYRAGPERKKITVDYQSTIMADLNQAYKNSVDECSQLKMQNMALEQHIEDCQKQMHDARMSAIFCQRSEDRHGRLTELARRKAHLAGKTLGDYELLYELLLDEIRKHNEERHDRDQSNKLVITPLMRPQRIRSAYHAEVAKLDAIEAKITEQAVQVEPPENGDNAIS